MPAVLQRLMRHAEIATTMEYYATIAAAGELWGREWGSGNNFGNKRPEGAQNAEGASSRTKTGTLIPKGLSSEGTDSENASCPASRLLNVTC